MVVVVVDIGISTHGLTPLMTTFTVFTVVMRVEMEIVVGRSSSGSGSGSITSGSSGNSRIRTGSNGGSTGSNSRTHDRGLLHDRQVRRIDVTGRRIRCGFHLAAVLSCLLGLMFLYIYIYMYVCIYVCIYV